jgi:hypothetical protein
MRACLAWMVALFGSVSLARADLPLLQVSRPKPAPEQAAPPSPHTPEPAAAAPTDATAPACAEAPYWAAPDCSFEPVIWGSCDYLLWWMKDGPLPVPLITTGPAASQGEIGQPGTRILFGGSGLDFGTFAGVRAALGAWIDPTGNLGIELGGFYFEQRSVGFGASSDAAGNPVLAVPVNLIGPGAPSRNVFFAATPALAAVGSLSANSTTRLWSAEANGLVNLGNGPLVMDYRLGFRHTNLKEDLNLYLANQMPFDDRFADHFRCRNEFYGAQFGGRIGYRFDRLSVDLFGQVALGVNHEVVQIDGNSFVFGGVAFPVGFLAQPSNSGRRTRNEFAVIPEARLTLGWELARGVRALLGYTFLYWSDVARPGNQVDQTVNVSQFPAFTPAGGPLIGPARPEVLFRQSEFWAQGLNFGVEVSY